MSQLLDKKVDAVTTDDAILKGYAAQSPSKLKVVGKPFDRRSLPRSTASACRTTTRRCGTSSTTSLEAASSDGTWQKIYDGTLGKSGSTGEPAGAREVLTGSSDAAPPAGGAAAL